MGKREQNQKDTREEYLTCTKPRTKGLGTCVFIWMAKTNESVRRVDVP
jgi:hypothetical protein